MNDNKRSIISVLDRAQRAADFILGKTDNETKDEVGETTDESVVS